MIRENAREMDIRDMFDMIADMLNDKESNDDSRRKQAFETSNRNFNKKLYFIDKSGYKNE